MKYVFKIDNGIGFKDSSINEILSSDIKISNDIYNAFFQNQSQGKQYNIKNINGTTFDEIFEEILPTLEKVKTEKNNELSQKCQNVIMGGFYSTAYQNINKFYGSTIEDQTNITGNALSASSKIAGVPECQNDIFIYKAQGENYLEWTAEECSQLARDFKTFKEQQLIKNETLKNHVNTLTVIEDIQKVTWDTVIPTT